MKLRRPPVLRRGDAVALVCPSGPVRDGQELEGCVAALEALGFRPRVGRHATQRLDYLAGTDEQRASDLNDAFGDDEVRAVFCVRGGYGSARLLPLLDFEALRRAPKLFVGFSDLTALHAAIARHAGLATLHAATVAMAHVNEGLTEGSLALLERVLLDARPLGSIAGALRHSAGRALVPGVARGPLVGGNLTVLASILGSPHARPPRGAILFLEDVGEEPYRLDRCLTQLRLAGWLDAAAGLVLGQFTRCHSRKPGRLGARETLERCVGDLRMPVLVDFPAGHCRLNAPLLLGARATLDATGSDLVVEQGLAPLR